MEVKIKIRITHILALLIILIPLITYFYLFKFNKMEKEIDISKYLSENDIIIGNISSNKILIEYSSFDCPACRYFHLNFFDNIENSIKNNEVAYVLRLIPEKRSDLSYTLIKAAYCSVKIKNSLDFVKSIFQNYEKINSFEDIYNFFEGNVSELKNCINSIEAEIYLKNCYKKFFEDKFYGTPSFILIKNGKIERIIGAQPINLN